MIRRRQAAIYEYLEQEESDDDEEEEQPRKSSSLSSLADLVLLQAVPSWPNGDIRLIDDKRSIHQQFETQMMPLRILQIVLFLISYNFARTVADLHDWKVYTSKTLLFSSLYVLLFSLLMSVLPSQVIKFLAMMALPPYVDEKNLEFFYSVVDEQTSATSKVADAKNHASVVSKTFSSDTQRSGVVGGCAPRSPQLSPNPSFTPCEAEAGLPFAACVSGGSAASTAPSADGEGARFGAAPVAKQSSQAVTGNRPSQLLVPAANFVPHLPPQARSDSPESPGTNCQPGGDRHAMQDELEQHTDLLRKLDSRVLKLETLVNEQAGSLNTGLVAEDLTNDDDLAEQRDSPLAPLAQLSPYRSEESKNSLEERGRKRVSSLFKGEAKVTDLCGAPL